MKTTAEILNDVEVLLFDRSRWCQGAPARTAAGKTVPGGSSLAVCWCMIGAVSHCSIDGARTSENWQQAVQLLERAAGGNAATFNDHHEHAEVLLVIAQARSLAHLEAS